MKARNIMYVVITLICIMAIIIGVYYQVFSKKTVSESKLNIIINEIKEDYIIDNPKDLLEEFNELFTNKFYDQAFDIYDIEKIEGLESEKVVYTAYSNKEELDGKYEINVNLPVINIQGDVVAEYNSITQTIFADKTSNVLSGTNPYTIYDVEYVAYLNQDILSVVIKSTLKEGNNAQRIIVQTYNYNIDTGEKVTLNDILEREEINKKEVNSKIEQQVKEAKKQAETISGVTGQSVYKRDLNNAMYLTENVNTFFLGEDGQIYIVYAYGNNNTTSEIDIIKL